MNILKKNKSQAPRMMGRTTEGTIFEIVFIVLALLSWGFIAWLIARAPETVPTHFGPSGQPDAWGSPVKAVFPCLIITVVGVCMLAGAYFPGSVNLPFAIETPRQIALSMRMLRVMALLLLVLAVLCAVTMLTSVKGIWPLLLGVGLLLVVTLGFCVAIWRVR